MCGFHAESARYSLEISQWIVRASSATSPIYQLLTPSIQAPSA
ncbi:hypothetical protein [Rubritalea tangerina]